MNMSEFVLIFRRDYNTKESQPSEQEMQTYLKHWQDWFLSLAAQDLLVRPVQRWDSQGVVVTREKRHADGPYHKGNQSMGGLIIIKAEDYNHAREIAQGCPVLELGGTVEIRMAI